MVKTKKELNKMLKYEKTIYLKDIRNRFVFLDNLEKESHTLIWKYVRYFRKASFYFSRRENFLCLFKYLFYQRKKQNLGMKLGFSIDFADISEGLEIYHYGSIVINGYSKIGKNLKLHGNNCIGNKGSNSLEAPTIGDNVDVGFGASIIGNVFIANNVKIGAGAVVCKSCFQEGATLVGVPAIIKE